MEKKVKGLTDKIEDFKRFATVLLAVGVFFYLGVIIPTLDKTEWNTAIMMIMTTACLGASIFFFTKAKQFQKQINELKNEE
ncbi:YrhC family protein [Niallia sp. 01092]|uniref:YrhC family protein n=1 Tax=unclassified Niallia TaxID=2837522 RepID=UPI003FD44A4F